MRGGRGEYVLGEKIKTEDLEGIAKEEKGRRGGKGLKNTSFG